MLFATTFNLDKTNIIPFPQNPLFFTCLLCNSSENTVAKRQIACDEKSLLFPQSFQGTIVVISVIKYLERKTFMYIRR